jgi:hypothetical protein
MDEAALEILRGELTAAEQRLATYEALVGSDPNEWAHFDAAYTRMLVLLELGDAVGAGRIGKEYLRTREAWSSRQERPEPTLCIGAALLEAGQMDSKAFEKLRKEWLDGSAEHTGFAWTEAYALGAQSHGAALKALDARPTRSAPLPQRLMSPQFAEAIGRTYLRAGRPKEALPLLEQGTRACGVLDGYQAIFSQRAALELGEALEASGDSAKACDAYRRAEPRWAERRTRGITADKAVSAMRRLGCR